MKLQILGCAGGIGGRERMTTCMRIDDDLLLDAGTGLATLDLAQLTAIDHVFLTHSHLDHVAGLAFLLDSVLGERNGPVTVHASETVIATLKKHLFNWHLWPDFAQIPDPGHPVLRWAPMRLGETVSLNGRNITSYRVDHTVETSAYWVHHDTAGFVFTGDMASSPAFWTRLAAEERLRAVIVDCSFPDEEAPLAALSKHFCPRALVDDIAHMPYTTRFLISHLKPGQEDRIINELRIHDDKRLFEPLRQGDVFEF
jgi:3',5'-cyclic-nucleotide phosphodiesterase